jgi:hypothetical protein
VKPKLHHLMPFGSVCTLMFQLSVDQNLMIQLRSVASLAMQMTMIRKNKLIRQSDRAIVYTKDVRFPSTTQFEPLPGTIPFDNTNDNLFEDPDYEGHETDD